MTDDDWVRRTLHDAVDDLRPDDALDVIRSRTTRSAPRRAGWAWAAGGAAIGLAATVTAVAVLGQLGGSDRDTGGFSGNTPKSTASATAGNGLVSMPVYFVGETPAGPRLYREFARTPGRDRVTSVMNLALGGHSHDPDYKTPFTRLGTVHGTAELTDGVITVDLTGPDTLTDLPAGLDPEHAVAGVQQLIYTAQGALFTAGGEKESLSDTLVRFTIDGEPTDTLLGVPTADPLPAAPRARTIALVSIAQPADNQVIPNSFTLKGFAYGGFEGEVVWELRQGDKIVKSGSVTNSGGAGVYSEYAVGLSVVPPGDYLLVVHEADPTGGAEGPGLVVDDKRITIR